MLVRGPGCAALIGLEAYEALVRNYYFQGSMSSMSPPDEAARAAGAQAVLSYKGWDGTGVTLVIGPPQ